MAKYSRDCGAATPNGAPQTSHCDGFVGDALSFFFFWGGGGRSETGGSACQVQCVEDGSLNRVSTETFRWAVKMAAWLSRVQILMMS